MARFLISRWVHTFVLLVLLFGLLTVRAYDFEWTQSIRYLAFDTYNRVKPRPQTDTVVMVDIDEASLARVGQWAWPRTVIAQLVEELHDLGARAIVFDMVFAEPDRTSLQNYLKSLEDEEQVRQLAGAFGQFRDNDDVLAETIRKSGNVVTGFTRAAAVQEGQRKPHIAQPIGIKSSARSLRDTVMPVRAVTTNIPVLAEAAAGNGAFVVSPEVDGLIRKVPLILRSIDEEGATKDLYPTLSVEGVRVAYNPRSLIRVRDVSAGEGGAFHPPYSMRVGEHDVPLDADGELYVYFSKARSDAYVPAWRVLEGQVEPDEVSGRIVFVGTSAEGLRDIRSTPLDLFIPGVELHLNVAEQILTGTYLLRPWFIVGMELLVIAAAGLIIILLSPFVGAVFLSFFTLCIILAAAGTSWWAFAEHYILVDPVYPAISLAVLYATASLLTYIRTEAERRQVRQAFGLYISPDFMRELTAHPDKLRLGGEVRELSVMFTDIRSFTTISEGLTPEDLIQLMNDFLTPMSDLVMNNRGTIDKYMGDAMMAFWNAPLDDEDHARHACATALRMNEALAPINARLAERAAEQGTDPIVLKAGIGINTGPASVGNMGSRQRFAYSALGDTVNMASRLEGQTKNYGLTNLIGERTFRAAPDFAALEVDLIRVKGKMKPERVFTLVGDPACAETDRFVSWRAAHQEMIAAYRNQNFDQAMDRIGECLKLADPGFETVYEVYRLRIHEMLQNLPGPGWDGVYVATSK